MENQGSITFVVLIGGYPTTIISIFQVSVISIYVYVHIAAEIPILLGYKLHSAYREILTDACQTRNCCICGGEKILNEIRCGISSMSSGDVIT